MLTGQMQALRLSSCQEPGGFRPLGSPGVRGGVRLFPWEQAPNPGYSCGFCSPVQMPCPTGRAEEIVWVSRGLWDTRGVVPWGERGRATQAGLQVDTEAGPGSCSGVTAVCVTVLDWRELAVHQSRVNSHSAFTWRCRGRADNG